MGTDVLVKNLRYNVSIVFRGRDEAVRPNPEGKSRDWLVKIVTLFEMLRKRFKICEQEEETEGRGSTRRRIEVGSYIAYINVHKRMHKGRTGEQMMTFEIIT